jgi:hypothetical protein
MNHPPPCRNDREEAEHRRAQERERRDLRQIADGDARRRRNGMLAEPHVERIALPATVARSKLAPYAVVSALVAAMACGRDAPPPVVVAPLSPPRPVASVAPPVKLPDWTYWAPVAATVSSPARAPEAPLTDGQVTRTGGAETRWGALSEVTKAHLRANGFAVVDGGARTRIGPLYADLVASRTPFVVTIDTLFWLAHIALDRALAETEGTLVGPALDAILHRLDTRLTAESRDAHADLASAYTVARGVVAVAEALANKAYVPSPDLAGLVAKEKERVVAHAGPGVSPLLGVSIDYSAFAPRGMADVDESRLAYYRATAWLARAPFILAGRGDYGAAGDVSVTLARTHARAALLVSRLLDRGVDPDAATSWDLLERVCAFVGGKADDETPRELAKAAVSAGEDLKDARFIANVVDVDRVRRVAVHDHAPALFDGAAGMSAVGGVDGGVPTATHVAPSMRLLGGAASADGELLQALVYPRVGALTPTEHPPATAREGVRALPSALDVAAWLGSPDARTALHEAGDDAYVGYDAALAARIQQRAPADSLARHASLFASGLDAIATWIDPSVADVTVPGAHRAAFGRRKIEVGLAAWTELRHDAGTFTRLALAASGAAEPVRSATSTVTAFVEPHPEVIAKLVALVRQADRGFIALGAIKDASPAGAMMHEVDDLLTAALAVALREANDEPLTSAEAEALASIPARIASLEARVAATGSADVPMAIDVHTDLAPARALEEATGDVDEIYMVLAEPKTHALVLAVGAAVSHYELVQPAALRLTDTSWRARLQSGNAPPRDAFTSSYLTPASAAPAASASEHP